MAGGFAGQFAVGPALQHGADWRAVWLLLGAGGLALAGLILLVTPESVPAARRESGVLKSIVRAYQIVLGNPQSYICGLISGLLFAPTTIGGMTWGVILFQRDRGLDFLSAVSAAAMITLGWIVGSPLTGWLADRTHNKVLVLRTCIIGMALVLLQIAYLPQVLPLTFGCFLFGMLSGAAMIPYSIIKDVNPDGVKGSATGTMNFITFGLTALLAPLFGKVGGGHIEGFSSPLEHFRVTVWFWIAAVLLALLFTSRLHPAGATRGRQ